MKRLVLLFLTILSTTAWCQGDNIKRQLETRFGKDARVFYSEYDSIYHITLDGKEGRCDRNGKELVPAKYKHINYFRKHRLFIVDSYLNTGVYDANGKMIVPDNKYSKIDFLKSDGYNRDFLQLYDNEKVGVADLKGKVLMAPEYDRVKLYKDYCGIAGCQCIQDTFFIVYKGTQVGMISLDGTVKMKMVETRQGKDAYIMNLEYRINNKHYWCDTLFKISTLGSDNIHRYMVANKDGLIVVPSDVRYPHFNSEHQLIVMEDVGYNTHGVKIVRGNGKVVYDGTAAFVSDGIIFFQQNEVWGLMSADDGRVLVAPCYTSVSRFENDVAKVSQGENSFLIKNPLKGGGTLSSLNVNSGTLSDVDVDIPEKKTTDENRFAVIVANANYNGLYVPYAINDGKVFNEYCLKTLGIPKSNIFYLEDATLNNIRYTLGYIKDIAEVYEGEAKLIFYFSGLGLVGKDQNAYLIPVDGEVATLASTGFPLAQLYDQLGALDVQSSIVIIDAGFDNRNRDGTTVTGAETGVRARTVPVTGKTIALTASSMTETASNYEAQVHGLLTYYLCKKIKDTKGNVNMKELTDFVTDRVASTSQTVLNKKQTPQILFNENINLKSIKL